MSQPIALPKPSSAQHDLLHLIFNRAPLADIGDALRQEWQADLVLMLRGLDATTAEVMLCVPGNAQLPPVMSLKILAETLTHQRPVYLPDYADGASPFILAFGITSLAVLPAGQDAAVVVGWLVPQTFGRNQRRRLEAFQAETSFAIQAAQTANQLRNLEDHWNVIMETMPQGAIFVNTDGRRSYVNRAAADLLHLPSGYIEPARISQAMHQLRQQAVNAVQIEQQAAQLFAHGERPIRDWLWEFSHPTPQILSISVTQAGENSGWLWLIEDVTARKLLELKAIEVAVEKERGVILSDFIRDAGHEFRTPLSILTTGLYLIGRIQEDERRQEKLGLMRQQVDDINHLLDDLIDMTRLDTLDEVLTAPVALGILLHDVHSNWKHAAEKQNLTLRLELRDKVSLPTLHLNAGLLVQAFGCLVQNAIHYTRAGGTITLCASAGSAEVQISVQDTGIGIADADQSRIFERFYRADKARTERGSGLGLSIAQRIIELHGGRITVESTVGVGSTFTVHLPL